MKKLQNFAIVSGSALFQNKKSLIGMIHLPPLLSFSGFSGIKESIEKALADLEALEMAGFDGALIKNDYDKPHTEFANSAQISSFTAVAWEVCKKAKIPIGVQMMLNDWASSFAIAKVVGAQFTRLDVFVDYVDCEWGEIHPDPDKIIAYKNEIYSELILLADIQVKYKKMLENKSIVESARQAIEKGANVLIITGKATGEETPLQKVKEVKEAFPHFSVCVGAGISYENIIEQMSVADGAIVGSSIKSGGRIDYQKAKDLVMKLRG